MDKGCKRGYPSSLGYSVHFLDLPRPGCGFEPWASSTQTPSPEGSILDMNLRLDRVTITTRLVQSIMKHFVFNSDA